MGFFDGGTSESNSYSGLRLPGWENQARLSGYMDRTVNDLDFLTNKLKGDINAGRPQFNLTPEGFLPQQMEAVNTLGRNLFANVSSNYAARGLTNPANVSGVIGGALREAAPALMPIVGQNVRDQMLIPETIMQGRFGALQNVLNLSPSLMGSESHSKQEGPSMLAQNVAQWANPNSYANLIQAITGSLKPSPGGR